jgi:hypothetical protein
MRIVLVLLVAVLLGLGVALSDAGPPAPAPNVVHVPSVDTPWPGKIFVAHDEWAISDYGYQMARASAQQLTLNIARFFTGGRPGRFLSYSNFYGLIGFEIAATMTAAGHSWTVDTTVPFTLATLLQFDAVFVGGTEVDNTVLIDYVRAGGGVFVEGGTGLGGVFEAQHWAAFLNSFGLGFGSHYDLMRTAGIYPVVSSSPLFAGVTELYEQTGNPVLVLDPSDPRTNVLVPYAGHALYATYSASVIPVSVEICDALRDAAAGRLWASILGADTFDVRSIDPASVRLLSVAAAGKPVVGYTSRTRLRPRIGRAHADRCRAGGDRSLDLVVGFHDRDVLRAAEALLGHDLYDGDLLAVTLTGRLKPALGGTPIVGEAVVEVKGPRRPHHRHRDHRR